MASEPPKTRPAGSGVDASRPTGGADSSRPTGGPDASRPTGGVAVSRLRNDLASMIVNPVKPPPAVAG